MGSGTEREADHCVDPGRGRESGRWGDTAQCAGTQPGGRAAN
jgi:hypothetical protein